MSLRALQSKAWQSLCKPPFHRNRNPLLREKFIFFFTNGEKRGKMGKMTEGLHLTRKGRYEMELLLCAVCGYLIGGINPSYLFCRRAGFDIRQTGTKNAGATNTMFALGLKKGIIVMLIDILKALLCVVAAALLFPESTLAAPIAGVACAAGHVFPVYLGFRGGKGTACLCGTIIGLTPELIFPLFLGIFLLGVIFNRASILPIITAGIYPIAYFLRSSSWSGTAVLALLVPLLLWSHRGNRGKFKNGEETPFRTMIFHHNLDDCVERKESEE